MYKLIILIISSNDLPIYYKIRQVSIKYLNLFPDEIKYFFIEYNNSIDQDIIAVDDHIFIKGTETGIEGIYYKTIKAIEYINNNYQYEYLLRANVSTFLNIYTILKSLSFYPKTNFAGGHVINCCYPFPWLGGLCMLFSRDVTNILVNYTKFDHYLHKHDDVIISLVLLENNIKLQSILTTISNYNNDVEKNCYSIIVFENGYFQDQIIPIDDNILCYRIKNSSNREIFDLQYHNKLLELIYNKNIISG